VVIDLPNFRFEDFVSSMENNQFWVVDDAISKETQASLLEAAKFHFQKGEFIPAKIGKGAQKKRVKEIRGDLIYWIEKWDDPALTYCQELYEQLLTFAKRGLYLPIKRYESHLAYYAVGTRYLKHVDRHETNPSRVLSSVLYLGDWKNGQDGELVLYLSDGRPSVSLDPSPRRLVVFDSRLVHEVRLTKVSRWSLTTWFRDDVHPLLHL